MKIQQIKFWQKSSCLTKSSWSGGRGALLVSSLRSAYNWRGSISDILGIIWKTRGKTRENWVNALIYIRGDLCILDSRSISMRSILQNYIMNFQICMLLSFWYVTRTFLFKLMWFISLSGLLDWWIKEMPYKAFIFSLKQGI